jgi:hypothetical protein
MFPSSWPPDRDFMCNFTSTTIPSDYYADMPIDKIVVNTTAFDHLTIPFADKINFLAILIKRDRNGKPFFKVIVVYIDY